MTLLVTLKCMEYVATSEWMTIYFIKWINPSPSFEEL